jgi:hypothetical protein
MKRKPTPRLPLPPPPPEPERLLLEPLSYSPEDAALVTGLARTAIYALIRDGKLKSSPRRRFRHTWMRTPHRPSGIRHPR